MILVIPIAIGMIYLIGVILFMSLVKDTVRSQLDQFETQKISLNYNSCHPDSNRDDLCDGVILFMNFLVSDQV